MQLVLCDNRDEKYYHYRDNIFLFVIGNNLSKIIIYCKFVAAGKDSKLLNEEFITCYTFTK